MAEFGQEPDKDADADELHEVAPNVNYIILVNNDNEHHEYEDGVGCLL